MNITPPNPKAMQWGAMSYKNGKSITDNPFPEGSENFDNWDAGWLAEQRLAISVLPVGQDNCERAAEGIMSDKEMMNMIIGPIVAPFTDQTPPRS